MQIGVSMRIGLAILIMAATLGATPSTVVLPQPLIDAVLRSGPDGQVPAHLSVVLGLTKAERPIPVKQAVLREGSIVRTFNVSTVRHDDVVLMSYDEQARSMQAYLTSPAGTLRKAISYRAGGQAVERTTADAAIDFAMEVKRWITPAPKALR